MPKPPEWKMQCPVCKKDGYLVQEQNRYFKVIHKVLIDNQWKIRPHYIGSPEKAVAQLKKILAKPEIVEKKLDFIYELEEHGAFIQAAKEVFKLRRYYRMKKI